MRNSIYSTLVGDESKSIFFYSKITENQKENVFRNEKIDINPYFEFSSKKMYKSLSYAAKLKLGKGGFSEDVYPEMQWDLKNDTKDILGYKCRNATTNFRGREYEVWFTTEIPGNYFPWKFSGLPGLILSYSDKEKTFSGTAISIVQNKMVSKIFNERIDKFYLQFKSSAIPYKEEISYDNNWLNERKREEISSMPLNTNYTDVPIRSLLPEISFEWEKEPKKP
ncbi:GLPGLI family protein [Chryseobacterium oryzae]|uniref:GLPGLI family protein n=1 Tax=Chryseobacterium oryzae TaxID=2929799 RepID=A0ABY4BNJ0_9FLAO|nr:GLPGLI family protein [Chryseobacterium oryzae]UOE39386.1 GLPGLI family protein [Chryseobacterium oryzae]